MFAVGTLGIVTKRRLPRALVVLVLADTPRRACEVQCLIDSGAERNFVSQAWIKENELPEDHAVPEQIQAVDEHRIPCYGSHQIDVEITDHEKVRKRWKSQFHAVDMRGYDMILGYSWLSEIDPDIRWRDRRWSYRGKPSAPATQERVRLCEAEKFAKLAMLALKGKGEAYVTLPYQLLPTESLPQYAEREAARCGALQAEEPNISGPLQDLAEMFFEALSDSLNTHDQVEHLIELMKGKLPRTGPIYKMSQDELATIRDYLVSALEKKWIRPSSSSTGALVLFVKKPDETLRLCVDYRGLNEITIKNKYPLPLLSETLERFAHARHFTKIDIRNAYHRIRIRKGDEWKTAFRTRYEQFEYQVMPFGLANAPAIFQSYVNHALKPYLDICCVIYLNDVLIYSETEEQHWEHVRKVLRALLEHRLYAKLAKCAFNRSEVTFLRFVVGRKGIQMKQSRIDAIASWPKLESAKDILVFLRFAGFYRRFIRGFSQIVAPLTDLTKGAKKGQARSPFALTEEARSAFETLKKVFITAPILEHYDWNAVLRMETDAFNRGADDVLSQKSKNGQWHLIAYFSYKFKGAEVRWDTHDKELYAIVLRFKNWRHYLQGSKHSINVITDHNNLRYFMTTKELNARQVRWAEKLAAFDFNIEYRRGKLNPADAPSRRPDIIKPDGSEENNDRFLSTLRNKLRNRECQPDVQENEEIPASVKLAALTTQLSDNVTADTRVTHLNEKVLARSRSILDTASSRLLVHQVAKSKRFYLDMTESMAAWLLKLQQRDAFVANCEWRQRFAAKQDELSKWSIGRDGLLRRGLAVYVLEDSATKEEILHMNHDDPEAGHFARARTESAIRRKYFWFEMIKDIAEYVRTCPDCQRVRVHHHKPYDSLVAISPGDVEPFHTVIMDFITDMPPAKDPYTGKTSDAILVLVDKLTKHATYIAITKDLNAEGLANILWREFVSQHDMMRSIISDRGSLFTSHFWTTLCWHLSAKRKLSTAFHSQTDGQTERQNQVLEHYLRVYANYKMDNWPELLSMTAFAYNNSVHASTGKTPHELLKGYIAGFANAPEGRALEGEAPLATERAQWLRSSREHLMELWKRVAAQQTKYYNEHHKSISFQIGDKVLLRSINIRTLRPKKKIDHKQLGPFRILEKIGTQAYKLELPERYDAIHPVFHISLLEPWHSRGEDPEPQAILVEGEEEWEVDKILDKRIKKGQLEYLVQWADSPPYENFWEPVKNLRNAKKSIAVYEEESHAHQPAAKISKGKRRGRPRKSHGWEVSREQRGREPETF